MKRQVLYIHGGESFIEHEHFIARLKTAPLWHMEAGESVKKWTGSLAEELGPDYEVIFPPMPNKQNAQFLEWSIWFERHLPYLREGVVLIGCSLGAMFLAKYLSLHTLSVKPAAVILMAGAYALPGFSDESTGDFLVDPQQAAEGLMSYKTIIMHSEDDFVVPFAHAEALHQAVPRAEFVVLKEKNHFLVEELPELVDLIKELG